MANEKSKQPRSCRMSVAGWLSVLGIALALALPAVPAAAQSFPTKQVRIVLAYGPVGAPDYVGRLLAERMAPDLGQPVIVENRGGGAGMPAINEVLNSPADGHTLFAADSAHWAINPALQPVSYDFMRDFAPVTLVFTSPMVYVVLASSPATTLQELIALAKAKPGTINYASPGIGSLHHLQSEFFGYSVGAKFSHVPYKGGGEMVEGLLRGDVQFMVLSLTGIISHVKSGKVRMLAVSTKSRFKLVPDVATVAELTNLRDFDFAGQMGIVVRAGTPRGVIDRLSAVLAKALAQPDIIAKSLEPGGLLITPTTPEQLAELIRSDIRKFATAVKVSGAKL